jgi:hypothetical protein
VLFPVAMWKVRRGMAGRFRAFGHSMEPVIPSGSRVTIEPVAADRIDLGDIVVARVGGSPMLHLVKTVDRPGGRVEISGTSGPANGWTTFDHVDAICTEVAGSAVPGSGSKALRRRGLRRRPVPSE